MTLHQIVKEGLLKGRNGAYKHVSSLVNLIHRGQLKAIRSTSKHGSCWLVDQAEIIRYNKRYDI